MTIESSPAAAGVKRISLATSLYRAAMTGLIDAAREVRDAGRFDFVDRSVTTAEFEPDHGRLITPTPR